MSNRSNSWLSRITTYLLLLGLAIAQEYPVRTIYQAPPYYWYENLRVRQNGSILVTEVDKPLLLEFDPFSGQGPQVVHDFTGYLSLLGISETKPDLFAVIVGNFSLNLLISYVGSYAIWTVDYRPESCKGPGSSPIISKLADIPQAAFPNGMTYIPTAHALFIADSQLGVIFRMDIHTGQYNVAINNTLTNKCNPSEFEGINGIKYLHPDLYWTNAGCEFFAKIAVDPQTGTPVGEGVIVSSPHENMDDFALAPDGTAYLAGGFVNEIFKITPDGQFSVVAGHPNSSAVAEPTALAFGRTEADRNTLYVTTGGALGDPINGTTVVGAQLLAIDLGYQK